MCNQSVLGLNFFGRSSSTDYRLRMPRPLDQPPLNLEHITPKVANEGHKRIVNIVLPVLAQVLCESDWHASPPLLQAREALRRVQLAGDKFWGEGMYFSRKRTVEDAVVARYHSEVRLSLL